MTEPHVRSSVDFNEGAIDKILSELDRCHLPGGAVGIAVNGRALYRKAFGLADMRYPVVLTPASRFRLASTSKQFVALAYMLLCEEGRADIDDAIGKYLPELSGVTQGVTVRQLMSHVGGLRDVHDIVWQFSGIDAKVSSEELLSMYRDIDDANASPGAAWIYNNGGFLLLSAAVERLSGKALEEVLRNRIFDPIGMYDTSLQRVADDCGLHTASPYAPISALGSSSNADIRKTPRGFLKSELATALAGEGGAVSTIDDMLRWLSHMDSPVVGSAATWAAMKTPQKLANGASTGYGCGLIISNYRGHQTLSHPGRVPGSNAQMLKVESVGLDIVVLLNRGDISAVALANGILDSCLPALSPTSQPGKNPIAAGVFRSKSTGRVIELSAEMDRCLISVNGADIPMQVDDSHVLRPTALFHYQNKSVVLPGRSNAPRTIQYIDGGYIDDCERLDSEELVLSEDILGRYRSVAIRVDAIISLTDQGPRFETVGQYGSVAYSLMRLARGVWRVQTDIDAYLGGVLSFNPDRQGFGFSTGRNWGLLFRRTS